MTTDPKFQVGQKLFVKYSRGRSEGTLEIRKVGRKWLELSGRHRADKGTLRLDGGGYSSPGQCYLSRSVWEAEQALTDAWDGFRAAMAGKYRVPGGLTVEAIKQASKLLQLEATDGRD